MPSLLIQGVSLVLKRSQHLKNPEAYERRKAKVRETYAANAAMRAAKVAAAAKWRAENPEARKAIIKRFFASAKGKAAIARNNAARRTRGVSPTAFDAWVLKEAQKLAKLRTHAFGFKWEVDHVQPISRGGTGAATNLQVVPRVWNLAKHNTHAERFLGA